MTDESPDPNAVTEWLDELQKGEQDPTAASYPDTSELNRDTAMAWFQKPENSRWKGHKRGKKQEDYNDMEELWTKITGMKIILRASARKPKPAEIQQRQDVPPLRDLISSVCQSVLTLGGNTTPSEYLKLRYLTRVELQPHLQNLVLSFEELTPWIDHFLRVYMPRPVYQWKNSMRQPNALGSSQGKEGEPSNEGKTNAKTRGASPKNKRKAEDLTLSKERLKKTRNVTTDFQMQSRGELLPFIHREIEVSLEHTANYVIAATAALIQPVRLPSAVLSVSHLSFDLLQRLIIQEGGDFAEVGKTLEIWDPTEDSLISNDFQLRNAIGLQWVKTSHAQDESMFKLVVRSKAASEGEMLQ